ncbi:NHL repeat-containing protein [Calothrix sp. NIES-4101]|nr:NHL repeat-containing protein [Calothrix sp. NIES-4101]
MKQQLLSKLKNTNTILKSFSNKIRKIRIVGNQRTMSFFIFMVAGLLASLLLAMYLANSAVPVKNQLAKAPPAKTHKTSWIGNTFGNNEKWVQIQINGMYVTPDGTVYTNSYWDEAGREAGIYKNGNAIAKLEDLHGWGRLGGIAVTVDRKYIYLTMQQEHSGNPGEDYPPDKTNWYCVRRYDLSGKPAPFPGGRGWDKSMLIVSTKSELTGLATVGDKLYVSDKGANQVHIYDQNNLNKIQSFAVKNPGQIAVDKQGTLWVIQSKDNTQPGKILHYSPAGKELSGIIADIENPNAIAVDNQGRLLVAENGKSQQILIYNISNQPKQVGTFGVRGGVYAGVPGEIQNLKFYGIHGVGSDSSGNIYVANDGFNRSGVDLRKLSPNGKLQWQLLGLHFLDNADVDPASDGAVVFAKQERFLMDYSKPAGKQWVFKGHTLNPFKYPQDPRLHTVPDATVMRRIQGKLFMFLMDMYGGTIQIYRFNKATDGEIAIPAGMFVGSRDGDGGAAFDGKWPPFQPQSGEWIWRDKNGNGKFEADEYDRSQDHPYIGGWWIDSKGDIWKALRTQDGIGIRHYPFQGLDTHGNPIYSYKSMQKRSHPKFIGDLRRIEYHPDTDTMYLSGYTNEHPAINGDYAKLIGSEIVRIDNWSKGNLKPRWRIVLPTDKSAPPEVLTPTSMSIAGDYIFVTTVKTWETHVYSTSTGKLVRTLKPGAEVSGELGWVDIAYGVRAFRRKNGEYLVFLEEDFKGKVIMYQIPK